MRKRPCHRQHPDLQVREIGGTRLSGEVRDRGHPPFEVFVLLDGDACPLLVNEVGEDGELLAGLDVVGGPVVGELVAGFLASHALGDQLIAATELLPVLTSTVEGKAGVGGFLHAFVAGFGEPEFDGFGFGAGDGLDEAEEGFGSGAVCEAFFAVGCG
jgi:hypothetical protein